MAAKRTRRPTDEAANLDKLIEAGELPKTKAGQAAWVRRSGPAPCLGPFKKDFDPADTRAKINALRNEGRDEDASVLSAAARDYCGYDLTEVFAKGPFDGELHEYECPRCGLVGEYRAAHFNEEGQGTAEEVLPPKWRPKRAAKKTAARAARRHPNSTQSEEQS